MGFVHCGKDANVGWESVRLEGVCGIYGLRIGTGLFVYLLCIFEVEDFGFDGLSELLNALFCFGLNAK